LAASGDDGADTDVPTVNACPHDPQNRWPAGLTCPHDGQPADIAAPHEPQKRWPGGLTAPHA
jgi:hypothetical protein